MNHNNWSENLFDIPEIITDEETSLKSYNYNKYQSHSPFIIEKNNEEFKFDTSNLNYYNTNGISQDNLTKNELQNETEKQIFFIENGNKKNEAFVSLNKENINNNLENNNTNNVNNSKIIIEIKKDSKYEDQNENQFLIFNNGNYDTFSSNIIYEALNNRDKKRKEPKKIKKIFKTNSKKQKEKKIKSRKYNADNKRKKIKVKFLNFLIIAINEKLKNAGSKYFFEDLPQSFKINVAKEKNRLFLDLPLEEILLINNYNKSVLDYLEKNNDVKEKSNFNEIKTMKYYEIYNEYLLSKEFKFAISDLKQKKENDQYITDYILKADDLINFFRLEKEKKEKKNKK